MMNFTADDWVKIIAALAIALPGIIAAIKASSTNRIAKRNLSHMRRQDKTLEQINSQTNGKLMAQATEIAGLRAENDLLREREANRKVRETDLIRNRTPVPVKVEDVDEQALDKVMAEQGNKKEK